MIERTCRVCSKVALGTVTKRTTPSKTKYIFKDVVGGTWNGKLCNKCYGKQNYRARKERLEFLEDESRAQAANPEPELLGPRSTPRPKTYKCQCCGKGTFNRFNCPKCLTDYDREASGLGPDVVYY